MTRILKLLLIAAVAWPMWQHAAAQEVKLKAEKDAESVGLTNLIDVLDVTSDIALPLDKGALKQDVNQVNSKDIDNVDKQFKADQPFKFIKSMRAATHGKRRIVTKVTKVRANVPDGYSQITLNVLDTGDPGTGVWGDGTGYQMLFDADHNTYGSTIPATGALTTSGDVSSSTYALFEYKIPENADGSLTTSNIVLSGSASVTIPAGTYDWCITNPTPGDRMWIASEQGLVQGRYDDYVFESGFAYTFTISLISQNDDVSIDITSNYENPTNLVASDITNHQATITWSPGGDEASWNVQYKKKADFNWTSGGTVSSTSYSLENLDPLTVYQVRVQGIYADGKSGWALVSFKTHNNAAEFCEEHEMGEISYNLTDSYGDGWNGCAINIVDAESGTIIESITMDSGSSAEGTISVCYGRQVNFVWVKGDYPSECSFTITDPNGDLIYSASTTNCNSFANGYVFANYTMQMPNPTQLLDFESVDVNTSKTLTAYVYNQNNNNVQATLTTANPFSVASSTITLQPGLNNIPVTFTPTDPFAYNGTLTIDMNGETTTITLKGVGSMEGPEAIRDEAFFDGITYDWTNDEGTHTSKLTDVATDPDQIIAMMTEVYTNKTIPGNFKRGYTASLGSEQYDDVDYSGVGTITRSNNGTYSYSPGYGWNIPNKTNLLSASVGGYTWTYLPPTDYKPYNEGVTLLLVEVSDNYDSQNYTPESITDYNSLKSVISTVIKSVRVVSVSKRVGDGVDRGTIFKINCDKMNKFFLLAKGQLRLWNHSYRAISTNGCPYPAYVYRYGSTSQFLDMIYPLTSNMFEQFSPVSLETGDMADDLYQSLVNMQSFNVYHDCQVVPFAYSANEPESERHGHQFMMYGLDSDAADCQDVRDLMFFVPDYRMMYDSNRDNGSIQKFLNYNLDHQPSMGLFVIKQNPITGEQITGQDTYKLHLTWTSNLLDFLPGEDGQYTLYRVITNADGTKTYEAVGEFDPNTYEYYDNVPMIQTGQQVTYVVRGQDVEKFLDLQMSNEESYIIPGLDPSELVLLKDATHYSRFDAQRVRNCYSNKLTLKNNVGGMKQANLTSGTQLTITRIPQGGNVDPAEIATVTFNPSARTYTVQMADQATDETEFPECVDGSYAGYHANNGTVKGNGSWTGTYTVNSNGDINLGTLAIFDNFVQAIPDNNYHPIGYVYQVTSNYECTATSVYLNAAACSTGDEVWYAWTWNNDDDGKWLQGIVVEDDVLKFVPAKNNIIFARMNPAASNVPSWDARWNQTGNLSTQGYIGKTFTVNWGYNGAIDGSWGGDVIPDMAHSNTFRIPVYKTSSQINGSFTADEVVGDTGGTLGLPENVEFGVGVQLSSKSEILRYDTYRWGENEDRYIIEWADGDDEQDLPPTGLAMNQGEYYTISMNPDTNNETNGETLVSSGSGTATFVDEVPGASTTAVAYMYAPVVEAFSGRGDYNTYGGPLQSTAVGKMDVTVAQADEEHPMMSDYSWTVNGEKYAYYNFCLKFNEKSLPDNTYEIYKIRAWREVPTNMQGEEYSELSGRMGERVNFEDITYPDCDASDQYQPLLGGDAKSFSVTDADQATHTYTGFTGTFGARKLRTSDDETGVIEQLDMNFVVRLYFTKKSNLQTTQSGAPLLRAEGVQDGAKFFIVEQQIPYTVKANQVITGVQNLTSRQVVSEKYYNPAGIESDTPFKGVNIVVTRYSDGSTTTTKILK